MNGIIKTKTNRGFGFISREGETKDLFFHSSDLEGVAFDELQEGTAVTFDLVDGEKGPSAKNVKLAGEGEVKVEEKESTEEVAAETEEEAPVEEEEKAPVETEEATE